VFVGAAKGVARFDPQRGSLWAWLSGIARKQIAEYHRQTRSHRVLKADVFGLGSRDGQIRRAFESDTPLPDEICQRAEFRALARAALTALKPRHRECLIGRYFENLSLAELGARFELSRSAVNSLLHRARYELRAILLNLLDEESILEELGP